MALKKLNQFLTFDFARFAQGKTFMCIGIAKWVDYESKAHKGTKVEAVIARDDTTYKQKDGEIVNNLYEKIIFKVKKDVKIPVNAEITPVNPIAIVYGDYKNQLAVTCDDIRVAQQGRA